MPYIEPPPSIADLPKAYMVEIKHWTNNHWIVTQRSKDPDDPRSMMICVGCELCITKAIGKQSALKFPWANKATNRGYAQELKTMKPLPVPHNEPQKVGKRGKTEKSSRILPPTSHRPLKPGLARSAPQPRQVRSLAGVRATTQTGQPFEFYLDVVNMASETGYPGLQSDESDTGEIEHPKTKVNMLTAVQDPHTRILGE